MTEPRRLGLDKALVRASFDRAASAYDEAAVLQREIARRLLDRLDLVRLRPGVAADLGAGTGECTEALARRYPRARLVAVDLAEGMLRQARRRFSRWSRWRGGHAFVAGDVERLPLADASCDLLLSSLTFQWCTDLERTFRECRRVLRPGGLLMFTSFGPDTLKELRASWAAVDGGVHVNSFADMHDVGDALVGARLADPVMDMEHLTLTYPAVLDLMRDLKVLGAHNLNGGRPRGLTGKERLKAVVAAYEAFRRDGVLPATYEVVYGHAWAPEAGAPPGPEAGEVRVPLSALRRGR